jgi:hypothetical protein
MKRYLLPLCAVTFLSSPVQAEEFTPSYTEWQRTAQNPLSPNFRLPFEYNFYGNAPAGNVNVLSFAPIMPIKFDGWNIINQLTLSVMWTPGDITGIKGLPEPYTGDGHGGSDGYAAGLADTDFTSYFSSTIGKDFTYGFGPTFTFPTDEPTRELGSGKFSMGPALMLVYQPKQWTLSLEIQQIWSVFGSSEREEVSQMIVQPSIYYNLPQGWYLLSDMQMVANWRSNSEQRWTVPIGAGVGKLFKIGENAINSRLGGYYNPVTPDAGPTWSMNFSVEFIFGN